MELLARSGTDLKGKHVVVLGRSLIVGKPIALLALQKRAGANGTVTICHSGTANLPTLTRQADVLIAAIGRPEFVTADMVKPGVVIIDVGINRVPDSSKKTGYRLTGDVHFQAQRTVAGAAFPRTPVDTLVMECTRGATPTLPHVTRKKEEDRLINAINRVADRGGDVLLPAFAFGRMQEILLLLQDAADAGELVDVPIYCSGLGMDLCDYLDAASKKTKQVKFSRQVLRDLGVQPLSRRYVQPGKNLPAQGIYLLSSGMLVEKTPAWRIAANILDDEENAVFFVGYCDPETPGGELIGMAPGGEFKFKGLDHVSTLRAEVERFHLSGHADRDELVEFACELAPKDIVLTHGDPPARAWMKETLAAAMPGTRVHDPAPGVPLEL